MYFYNTADRHAHGLGTVVFNVEWKKNSGFYSTTTRFAQLSFLTRLYLPVQRVFFRSTDVRLPPSIQIPLLLFISSMFSRTRQLLGAENRIRNTRTFPLGFWRDFSLICTIRKTHLVCLRGIFSDHCFMVNETKQKYFFKNDYIVANFPK